MTCYRATVATSFVEENETPGIIKCVIPSTEDQSGPSDAGDEDFYIDVHYTSPYSWNSKGAFLFIPPDGTDILVEKVGKEYYYLTSIVSPTVEYIDEVDGSTNSESISKFSIDRKHEPVYNKSNNFPNSLIMRHERGHRLTMKDETPLDGDVHNSKIEVRSAKGKKVELNDSGEVDSMRFGVEDPTTLTLDGITIGNGGGLVGAKCIKTEAELNISTISHSGDIRSTIQNGGNYTIENKGVGTNANPVSPTGPNFGNISMASQFGDLNLIAGNNMATSDPVKSILGASNIIIEALGLSRPGGAYVWPVVKISSDGSVEIISNDPNPATGTINLQSTGDINIESTSGNVNIKGVQVHLNPLPGTSVPFIPVPNVILRGYVPFGWMI